MNNLYQRSWQNAPLCSVVQKQSKQFWNSFFIVFKKEIGKQKFPLKFLEKITNDSANVLHPKYFTKWGAIDFEVALYTISQIIFGKIQEENVPVLKPKRTTDTPF